MDAIILEVAEARISSYLRGRHLDMGRVGRQAVRMLAKLGIHAQACCVGTNTAAHWSTPRKPSKPAPSTHRLSFSLCGPPSACRAANRAFRLSYSGN